MLTYLSRLTAERDSLTQAATDLANRAANEERDLTETERASLSSWESRCGEIDAQLTEYNAQAQSQRAYAALRSSLTSFDEPVEVEQRSGRQPEQPKSWGELFIESDAFKNYGGKGSSQGVELPFELEQRAAVGIGTFPDQGLPPFYWNPPQYNYVSPLIAIVNKVSTSSNVVSYVEWTPNPMGAAPVVAEGQLKPEAAMTATGQSQQLVTWAHYKEITRQALEDIPQIRTTVENRLRQGITRAIEDSIAASLVAATLPPVTGSAAGGDSLLGVIREGIATVQAAGFATPNAVVLNPADAAAIDVGLLAGTLNGPVVNGRIWGIPIVPSNGCPAGTAWVGDFSVAVTLFTRGTTTVYLTDSHADNFLRNILLLLAETRGLAVVVEPAALAECTVGAVAAASQS